MSFFYFIPVYNKYEILTNLVLTDKTICDTVWNFVLVFH